MPSELGVTKQTLVEIGYIDEDYNILEIGRPHVLFRIIISATGPRCHVVVKESSVELINSLSE